MGNVRKLPVPSNAVINTTGIQVGVLSRLVQTMDEAIRRERSFFWLVCIGVMIITIVTAQKDFSPDWVFKNSDSDDIMHILAVRDWLSGQSWYDMTQYRIQPPEGLSMHWSRYAMAGPAIILAFLEMFLSPESAEIALAVIWPTLLKIAFVLILGLSTTAVFGGYAGGIALIMFMVVPGWGLHHLGIGQMDHHGIQLVLMALAISALIWPKAPILSGLVAAFTIALSLAIGLETLFIVIGFGLAMVVLALVEQEIARTKLLTFCLLLPLFLLVLHIGQTLPENWLKPACDRLSLPILSIAIVGALSGIAGLLVSRNRILSFTASCVTAILGIAIIFPLVSSCLQGPYGNLPEELQIMISERITEARPALALITSYPELVLSIIIPATATIIFAWRLRYHAQNLGIIISLLILAVICLVTTFWQIRQSVFFGPIALPLVGFVLSVLFRKVCRSPKIVNNMIFVTAALCTLLSPQIASMSNLLFQSRYKQPGISPTALAKTNCERPSVFQTLNTWPKGLVLAPLNLGALVIYTTHHNTLSAPYHRNAKAYSIGVQGLDLEEDSFQTLLINERIDYLLLCRNNIYNTLDSIGSRIAAGYVPDYLSVIPTGTNDIIFLMVKK